MLWVKMLWFVCSLLLTSGYSYAAPPDEDANIFVTEASHITPIGEDPTTSGLKYTLDEADRAYQNFSNSCIDVLLYNCKEKNTNTEKKLKNVFGLLWEDVLQQQMFHQQCFKNYELFSDRNDITWAYNAFSASLCILSYNYQEVDKKKRECLHTNNKPGTTKEDFLEHVDGCLSEFIQEAKLCLPDSKQYYADLLLNNNREIYAYMYDNYEVFLPCFLRITTKTDAQSFMVNCLAKQGVKANDLFALPTSVYDFCETLTSVSQCVPESIKEFCVDNEDNRKFKVAFYNASMSYCNSVYEVSPLT